MHVTICCFVHYLFPVIILFIGKVDFQGNRMPSPVIAVPLITTALVMCTTSAQSVQYYITPSPDTIPCPGVPCFTLAEYANYNSQNPQFCYTYLLSRCTHPCGSRCRGKQHCLFFNGGQFYYIAFPQECHHLLLKSRTNSWF